MKRLLPVIFGIYFPCIMFGQVAQVYPDDQRRYNEWFDMVKYDSIASSADSGNAFNAELAMGQDYFFLNNTKIDKISWYGQGGTKYWQSKGVWKSNHTQLATIDAANSSDTIHKERFYWDAAGRDSVYDKIVEIVPGFITHEIDYYSYNSQGKVGVKISVDAALLKDTTMVELYYYGAAGNLDSIVGRDESGTRRSKDVFMNLARVEKVFSLMYSPATGGLDTIFTYTPVYNSSGRVYEIQEIHHLSSGPVLRSVHRFYKKPNSTIGLSQNDIQTISVYPNPVKDYFVLEIPVDADAIGEVQLWNVVGQLYKLKPENYDGMIRVDVSTLPSGFYMGTYVDNGEERFEFKMLK